MKNIRFFSIIIITLALLLIPLVAGQLTEQVNWSFNDFIVAGALLFITGLLLDVVLQTVKTPQRRMMWGGVIVLGFLYIWAELSVGIFTHWGS